MAKMEAKMERMKAEGLQAEMASLKSDLDQKREHNTAELRADTANLKTGLEGRFEAEVGRLNAVLVECLEMKDILVKMDPNRKKEIVKEGRSRPSGDRENILVAGGAGKNSVEMFNWRQKVWLPLQSLPEMRYAASSFIYNNHVTIAGGYYGADFEAVDTMIQMNVEASPDLSAHWSEYAVKLPAKLAYHSSVVYNDQLIVTGGVNENGETSDCIYEIQLMHPHTSKIYSIMPEPRREHGSAMFGDNLLVVGGRTSFSCEDILNSVLLYDVKKNEYKHLAPLPYEVSSFASVKYGDNIVVIGGCDKHGSFLNTVVMYNVVTQQSRMLPPMKCRKEASAAVTIGKNIVVLGGLGEQGLSKSVEVFSFDSGRWSDLPEMSEERWSHTAVVV